MTTLFFMFFTTLIFLFISTYFVIKHQILVRSGKKEEDEDESFRLYVCFWVSVLCFLLVLWYAWIGFDCPQAQLFNRNGC